jgi:hypothetical protein
MDYLISFLLRLNCSLKLQKGNCYGEPSPGRYNAAVDEYFYTFTLLVYFEGTVGRGTERGRHYVVKSDVKKFCNFLTLATINILHSCTAVGRNNLNIKKSKKLTTIVFGVL